MRNMHIYIIEKKYIHNLGKILYRFAQKKKMYTYEYITFIVTQINNSSAKYFR